MKFSTIQILWLLAGILSIVGGFLPLPSPFYNADRRAFGSMRLCVGGVMVLLSLFTPKKAVLNL